MKILAVDSSATAASVAVCQDDFIICESFINTKIKHSQTLMPMLGSMLECARISLDDIDLFAVSKGPGSFTGVRIGIAAVKGMAHAKDKPCVGVSTLRAMAENISQTKRIVCCVMDARCSQVYNALFTCCQGRLERLCDDRAVSIEQLAGELEGKKVLLLGDGAQLCYDSFIKRGIDARLAKPHLMYQRASGVARAALSHYNKGNYCSALELVPEYLRLSQAERELKLKQNA